MTNTKRIIVYAESTALAGRRAWAYEQALGPDEPPPAFCEALIASEEEAERLEASAQAAGAGRGRFFRRCAEAVRDAL